MNTERNRPISHVLFIGLTAWESSLTEQARKSEEIPPIENYSPVTNFQMQKSLASKCWWKCSKVQQASAGENAAKSSKQVLVNKWATWAVSKWPPVGPHSEKPPIVVKIRSFSWRKYDRSHCEKRQSLFQSESPQMWQSFSCVCLDLQRGHCQAVRTLLYAEILYAIHRQPCIAALKSCSSVQCMFCICPSWDMRWSDSGPNASHWESTVV